MTEPFDTLMAVQAHDTTLDQLRHRRETLPEREELRLTTARRAEVEEEMVVTRGLRGGLVDRQATLEGQITSTAERRLQLEERMRTGAGHSPRDLQAMDHEVHQLAERQSHLEDEEIALMEEEEPLANRLAELDGVAAELDARAGHLRAAVSESETEIAALIADESSRRAQLAVHLPSELSDRYERLRAHLGGVGASRLVGGRCDGCHLTLSAVEAEQFRQQPDDQYATCPQCDRILVH